MSDLVKKSTAVAITLLVCATTVIVAFLVMCTVVVLATGGLGGVVQVGELIVQIIDSFRHILAG